MNLKFIALFTTLVLFVFSAGANESTENSQATSLELMVFKTPTCGCCKKWMTHLNQQGIKTHPKDFRVLDPIKSQFGIQPQYRSCHTAITREGFAFEGHVPAKFIKKFLSENHPNAIGLSVPAMPVGSPGMEVEDRFMPYQILMLMDDGSSKVYAKINSYQEQF